MGVATQEQKVCYLQDHGVKVKWKQMQPPQLRPCSHGAITSVPHAGLWITVPAIPLLSIGKQLHEHNPCVPIWHPCGFMSLNSPRVHLGPCTYTDVILWAAAVSMQLLRPNRYQWDCWHRDARNSCALSCQQSTAPAWDMDVITLCEQGLRTGKL